MSTSQCSLGQKRHTKSPLSLLQIKNMVFAWFVGVSLLVCGVSLISFLVFLWFA